MRPVTLRHQPLLLRTRQIPVEGERVAVYIVEGEFARTPRRVAYAFGIAFDTTQPVLVEDGVRVLYQKAQADRAHLVLELKLHVELDRVTSKPDVVRRVGLVAKGQLEAKLVGVEHNRPLDVPRAENRVSFPEHGKLRSSSSRLVSLRTDGDSLSL